jgi:hypothetical protein
MSDTIFPVFEAMNQGRGQVPELLRNAYIYYRAAACELHEILVFLSEQSLIPDWAVGIAKPPERYRDVGVLRAL